MKSYLISYQIFTTLHGVVIGEMNMRWDSIKLEELRAEIKANFQYPDTVQSVIILSIVDLDSVNVSLENV